MLPKMSSALPILFQEIRYKGDYYRDGGLGDNFPTNGLKSNQNVLGIIVTGTDFSSTENAPNGPSFS